MKRKSRLLTLEQDRGQPILARGRRTVMRLTPDDLESLIAGVTTIMMKRVEQDLLGPPPNPVNHSTEGPEPELFLAETNGTALGVHRTDAGSVLVSVARPRAKMAEGYPVSPDVAEEMAASLCRFARLAREDAAPTQTSPPNEPAN